jgi:membrane fusion protein (multidrug efflux system)
VNLENIESLKVDFRVPEIYSTQLRAGQTVRITLDAIAEGSYEGTVYAIDPAHDPNGRAIILRARLPNRDGLLRSGMFARVTLLVDEREQAIVVPETALVPVGQDQFVYRVLDGKAVLTKIRIGQRRRGQVEIVEGLDPHSVIVTEGTVKLRDGSAVQTVAPKGA